jgi:hypothetical protein
MRFIALLVLVATTSAFANTVARDVRFNHSGRTIWGEVFYNCNAVEDIFEGHLRKLGASNIRVRCTGGIESWGGTMRGFPISVRATFNAPVPVSNNARIVTLKSRAGDNSCELHTGILNKVLPLFPAITVNSRRSRCSDNRSRWNYNLQILD